MLRNLGLGTKLSYGYGIAFALSLAAGLAGLAGTRAVNEVAKDTINVALPNLHQVELLKYETAQISLITIREIEAARPEDRRAIADEAMTALARIDNEIAELTRGLTTAAERRAEAAFKTTWANYLAQRSFVITALATGDRETADRVFNSRALPVFDAVVQSLDELTRLTELEGAAAAESVDRTYARSIAIAAVLLLLSGAIALGYTVWIRRKIVAPLVQVRDAMTRLTAGDLDVHIAPRQGSDEIATLVAAVESYRESIRRGDRFAADAEAQRGRLQAALTNLPHGLCMFDGERRLLVCNGRYAEMYRLPPELTVAGTSLAAIIDYREKTGNAPVNVPTYVTHEGADRTEGEAHVFNAELMDGRTIRISHLFMAKNAYVATHEDVTQAVRAESQILHMARHDALTNLANRTLFKEALEEALAAASPSQQVAVFCLDLDQFKGINDTLGHAVGDTLLLAVATRLRACLGAGDTVARYGGDEFAIIQRASDPAKATELAETIIGAVASLREVDGHPIVTGASIGIALSPAHGRDMQQLFKNADLALYAAKRQGRGNFRFFEPDMAALMQTRRRLELDLRGALERGEFALHYQPFVNIEKGSVAGFEALLRWNHPERGLLAPAEFIHFAEETGLIVAIGDWVIRQACADAAGWPRHVRVSVNLSSAQFRAGNDLATTIFAALAASGIEPGRLEIEITESILLENSERTLATLHRLRDFGVRISLDDFGTGYSSLSYLRSFPFDNIKIDQSFVRHVSQHDDSRAIVRAILGLGSALGIATTAEGVETPEQLEQLRQEGCREVQGYLFSRARPASELGQFLSKQEWTSSAAA